MNTWKVISYYHLENIKCLSPVAGFRAETSNQVVQQKAPIGNNGYKVINTQRTTYTIMVVSPTTFMPATDSRNCQSALRYLPLFVLKGKPKSLSNCSESFGWLNLFWFVIHLMFKLTWLKIIFHITVHMSLILLTILQNHI
jgi:hypothetical protein